MSSSDIRHKMGLRPVINCSGTMTGLGASIVVPQAIEAVTQILSQWTEIADLQRKASSTIARLTGAEAGFVTASCSAGISLAIAAAMTGKDLYAIEQLPDTVGLKNEVVVQTGHLVSYGAPVDQAIRLAGAKVVAVGQATSAHAYQLSGAINANTAAALYVISHHVVDYGQIPLKLFCEIAHSKNVPVIVDAASEYDLKRFLADGADIVLYSGHKFLGGPTSGIVAGQKALVAATYLQNRGIGRGMKIGKEGMAGVIAALEAWEVRDHAGIRARERKALDVWLDVFADYTGVNAVIEADPTDNPLDRLRVNIDAQLANISPWDFAERMGQGENPVIVRDHEVEKGYLYLDPCNLHVDEEFIVADKIKTVLDFARMQNEPIISDYNERILRMERNILNWPD